jgi:hypothetical protein
LFLFFLFSRRLHGALSHTKIRFGVKFGGTPLPLGVDFLGFFFEKKEEKCLELPEMARNFFNLLARHPPPPPQTLAPKNFRP